MTINVQFDNSAVAANGSTNQNIDLAVGDFPNMAIFGVCMGRQNDPGPPGFGPSTWNGVTLNEIAEAGVGGFTNVVSVYGLEKEMALAKNGTFTLDFNESIGCDWGRQAAASYYNVRAAHGADVDVGATFSSTTLVPNELVVVGSGAYVGTPGTWTSPAVKRADSTYVDIADQLLAAAGAISVVTSGGETMMGVHFQPTVAAGGEAIYFYIRDFLKESWEEFLIKNRGSFLPKHKPMIPDIYTAKNGIIQPENFGLAGI